jgi:hypothetical protein
MYKKSNTNLLKLTLSITLIVFVLLTAVIGIPSKSAFAESSNSPSDSTATQNSGHHKKEKLPETPIHDGHNALQRSSHCLIKINNSDFYYKGGNLSVQNTSPYLAKDIVVVITLPAGVKVSSSSQGGYSQQGNILKYNISSLPGYTNFDTSYVHDYLNYSPVVTNVSCGYSY